MLPWISSAAISGSSFTGGRDGSPLPPSGGGDGASRGTSITNRSSNCCNKAASPYQAAPDGRGAQGGGAGCGADPCQWRPCVARVLARSRSGRNAGAGGG